MERGIFVMADGLDGSGKGTIIDGLRDWAVSQRLRIFDLREHCKKHLDLPEIDDLQEYDVILSAEPTYSHVGRLIRFELIQNSSRRRYSGTVTAQAFSLDREVLYRKVIIPALAAGKHVFQERGVCTSIIYQPLQMEELLIAEILNLPGNRLAMEHAPDLLMIPLLEPEEALTRTKTRAKRDNAIFETLEFQRKIKERYTSTWFCELFERAGSRVAYIDTASPKGVKDTHKEAVRVFTDFLAARM